MAESADVSGGRVHEFGRAAGPLDERLHWARLRQAPNFAAFRESWLNLQCRLLDGAVAGVLLVEAADRGAFSPATVWPAGRPSPPQLVAAAQRAAAEGQGVALELDPPGSQPGERPHCVVAQPVVVSGGNGVVAVEVSPRSHEALEQSLRGLAWGAAWLELDAERVRSESAGRLEGLLQLVAAPLEHDRFRSAATAFASELASQIDCDRVSFGTLEANGAVVRAVSHSAQFAERSNLTRAVEAAMNEALDQEGVVVWPEPSETLPGVSKGLILRAHDRLAGECQAQTLCSVPLAHGDRFCGAITCERGDDRPFDAAEIELVEAAAALAGPLLDIQRRDDRWIGPKVLDAARGGVRELFGRQHLAAKAVVGLLTALLLFLGLVDGDFRVSAEGAIEAEVLRAAVAPFDGYVLEAPARAGDTVRAGDLLALLDNRELVLERTRWRSELLQLEPQAREAMAERDAAKVRVLRARSDQARAQLALADGRLAKTRITAAFDGVVATGDLSQNLGAPVARGDVLFEVAPLDVYRLVLQVDEKDVDEIRPSQRGSFVFTALPDRAIGFEVESITPVSTATDGMNAFRVEATLDRMPKHLRPGMEGVAKIEIGERRLLWIWTREIVDWVRLAAWRWLP